MSFSSGFGKAFKPVEYIIGRKDGVKFTVSKFAGDEIPLEEYEVERVEGKQTNCSCMAWFSKKTRPCKHGRMIQAWVEAGEPELGGYVCLGKGKDWVFELKRSI